jgi:hypothetical protein
MKWLICYFKGHIWRDKGTAMSHPTNTMWSCDRCGETKSTRRMYG